MVAGRILVAVVVAAVMGLTARQIGTVLNNVGDDGDHACDGHGHVHAHSGDRPTAKLAAILRHGSHEFLDMSKFLILGAIAAGAFKTFLPQHLLKVFVESSFLQVVGMMCMAILLSVCSEADAFVAASFQMFSSAAQLSFIAIGPMIDLKLIGMYFATFRRPMFWSLMIVPVIMVFLLSMVAGWLL
jgi:uncharacterized membrane protein YraQ (UPF0718 family)